MKWISVKDKLPEHGQAVLALSLSGQCVCLFLDTKEVEKKLISAGVPLNQLPHIDTPYDFCSQEVKGNVLNNVSHWMKLPESPK